MTSAADTLHQLFASEWDYWMEQYPTWASNLGDRRWNDRWEDRSVETIEKRYRHNIEVLARLNAIDRESLSASDRMCWDRQKAIDFFVENTAKPELDILNELDHYIAMPGQALGEKFDVRVFHDELLRDGALPLDVLEVKMDDWIARQKP